MSPADAYREIVAKLRVGKSIEAIVFARTQFGLDLHEAKELIEAILETIGGTRRDRSAEQKGK